MTEHDLSASCERAARGETDAVDEPVELAGERGDVAELRRLADADAGDRTAADARAELDG